MYSPLPVRYKAAKWTNHSQDIPEYVDLLPLSHVQDSCRYDISDFENIVFVDVCAVFWLTLKGGFN